MFAEDPAGTPPSLLKIEDFGAVSDDEILDTEAINKAIDSCSILENGIIIFSSGTYLSGSIHLKSNVTLQIEKEAKIQAAPKGIGAFDEPEPNKFDKYQDFGLSHFHNALIWGDSIENVSIRGTGTISGTASLYSDPEMGEADKAISLKSCKNVEIKNVDIIDGGYVAILVTGCEGLSIYDVKVENNGDGISVVGSNNIKVLNCEVEAGNNGISLKSDYSLGKNLNSTNINVTDCIISAGLTALSIGPETVGDFRNIQISNITIKKADNEGISFTSNHGSTIDGVNVQNVTMENVSIPFFVNLSKIKGGAPGSAVVGQIKNIRISNIVVQGIYGYGRGWKFASTVMGKSDKMLENIVLENMRLTYKGGSLGYLGLKKDPAELVLPRIEDYRGERYGLRPAYGLYCRYIKGLKIRNVSVDFEKEDPRPGMVLYNIEGIVVNRFYSERSTLRDYDIIVDNVSDFMITGSPGVEHIEKKEFTPLDSFEVAALPNPTAEEVAAELGMGKSPILLSDLPAGVIETVKKEIGISPEMLQVLVDKNISKVERADGVIYNIKAENKKGEKYELGVKDDGSVLSKSKV
jgi:hypothetical protein